MKLWAARLLVVLLVVGGAVGAYVLIVVMFDNIAGWVAGT